ncbi:hypothetical protein [Alkalibacterium kapii]|uniref:Uncharacterized protein n=1 Tax=Alkalibacterium kapii TaxID=426704 RepID=A0A511AV68_9LACT|nr:hypothetical protein [Alkalibacterium kapii]GEK92095.1 hypothetical protein AKA01nite_17170 [Alkalibacterium kapii]
MYLMLSMFIAIFLVVVLFFLGNYGLIIGIGILLGIFFRIVFLLEKISKDIDVKNKVNRATNGNKVHKNVL